MDTKQASGADLLDPFLCNLGKSILTTPLTHIYNTSLALEIVPKLWKTAQVTPLHKGGDSSNPHNYRPISKLPCLAKLFESLVNQQLWTFLNSNSILNNFQSGFRSGHSTVSAATLVLNDIACALDDSRYSAAIFIDLTKAFDTVDHSILLEILGHLGFDESACKWCTSYLSDRTQCVMADSARSSFAEVTKGVPQGSILGPLLFTLFINDIAPNQDNCKVHFYADDTVLYASAHSIDQVRASLQKAFDHFQFALFKRKLLLKASKTK